MSKSFPGFKFSRQTLQVPNVPVYQLRLLQVETLVRLSVFSQGNVSESKTADSRLANGERAGGGRIWRSHGAASLQRGAVSEKKRW
jgi:hypothetical protein